MVMRPSKAKVPAAEEVALLWKKVAVTMSLPSPPLCLLCVLRGELVSEV